VIRIHLDEDVDRRHLADALRREGFLVTTSFETGLNGSPDIAQLEYASSRNAIFLTANVGDFAILHREWLRAGRSHSGIIVTPQQRFSIGEIVRRISRIVTRHRDTHSEFYYLGNY
jgi:hypothetical protein